MPNNNDLLPQMNAITRRRKVEEMVILGIPIGQIAARLGYSYRCIFQDACVVRDRWREENPGNSAGRRRLRIAQLLNIMRKAMLDYDRSKQAGEDLQFITEPCFECGVREEGDPPCKKCGGKGEYQREMRLTVRGRDGNPAFLAIAQKCISEMARLEGSEAPKEVKHSGLIGHKHKHQHVHAVVDVGRFAAATDDDLLAAKSVLARIGQTK
jgi:hypothetical protein